MLRACGDAQGVACTSWAHLQVCATACDGAGSAGGGQPAGRACHAERPHHRPAHRQLRHGMGDDRLGQRRATRSGSTARGTAARPGPTAPRSAAPASPPGPPAPRTVRFNTSDPLRPVRTAARSAPAGGRWRARTAAAPPGPGRPPRATPAAADALMYSYDPNTAYWPSSWWNSAVALSHRDRLHAADRRHPLRLDRRPHLPGGQGVLPRREPAAPTRSTATSSAAPPTTPSGGRWPGSTPTTSPTTPRYLNEAVTIANYVNGLWDTSTCGGGVWWDRERTYKNSVTNGLYITTHRRAAQPHRRRHPRGSTGRRPHGTGSPPAD